MNLDMVVRGKKFMRGPFLGLHTRRNLGFFHYHPLATTSPI
jgi:hypothetical protein